MPLVLISTTGKANSSWRRGGEFDRERISNRVAPVLPRIHPVASTSHIAVLMLDQMQRKNCFETSPKCAASFSRPSSRPMFRMTKTKSSRMSDSSSLCG